MKRLLILLLLIVTTISGCVQTRNKHQKLSKMESVEVNKLEEIAKSMDVTIVDKHPKLVYGTFNNMFESLDKLKLQNDIDVSWE